MTSSEAGAKTKTGVAFFVGIVVALVIAYALAASVLTSRRDLEIALRVLHPFLRLPSGDGGVFAASIAFNGLYYAAATAIALRLGPGLARVAVSIALIAAMWLALVLLFDMGVWLLMGHMSHS